MADLDHDQDDSLGSTDARWYAYKRHERAAGREPMLWGDWLHAGQPLPIED